MKLVETFGPSYLRVREFESDPPPSALHLLLIGTSHVACFFMYHMGEDCFVVYVGLAAQEKQESCRLLWARRRDQWLENSAGHS